jgi:spore germination protein YaaH
MHRRSTGTAGRRLATLLATALGAGVLAVLTPAAVVPAAAATADPPRKIVTGWLPYWAPVTSADSVAANADLFTDASPFWYSAAWSGSASSLDLQLTTTAHDIAFTKLRDAGVKVLPSITDGMPTGQMAAVVKSPTLRSAFVDAIMTTVMAEGYDGIDLDFEKFAFSDPLASWPTTRPGWVAFIAELSDALHAQGKLLAVTTPPIYTSNRTLTTGTKWNDGYWVYDWAGIAEHVDRLRIMAYDYSVSGGPIAPLPWVEKIVAYAVTQVPSGKIQIGVPAYGRNTTVKVNGVSKVEGTCPSNKPSNYLDTLSFTASNHLTAIPSAAYTSDTVNRSKAVRTWSDTNAEVQFTYQVRYIGKTLAGKDTSCLVYRTGWYDHGASALARARLVEKYHLLGIAQWALGGEDDAQWSKLRSFAATIAPSDTSVSVYVPSATTYGTSTTVTARATSEGVAVTGAKAVLYARPAGRTAWTAVATSTTGADGRVQLPHTVRTATEYKVNVAGAWDRKTGTGTDTTGVRTAVALTVSDSTVKSGAPVTASVKLKPWITGQTVRRQVLRNGVWVTVATATTDRYGRAAFTFEPTGASRAYHYRLYAVGTSTVRGAYAYFDVTLG